MLEEGGFSFHSGSPSIRTTAADLASCFLWLQHGGRQEASVSTRKYMHTVCNPSCCTVEHRARMNETFQAKEIWWKQISAARARLPAGSASVSSSHGQLLFCRLLCLPAEEANPARLRVPRCCSRRRVLRLVWTCPHPFLLFPA